MVVIGDIDGDGLGCVDWWAEAEDSGDAAA